MNNNSSLKLAAEARYQALDARDLVRFRRLTIVSSCPLSDKPDEL